MIIDVPDSEAGLLMYALRPQAFKAEKRGLKETADRLYFIIKDQIAKNVSRSNTAG